MSHWHRAHGGNLIARTVRMHSLFLSSKFSVNHVWILFLPVGLKSKKALNSRVDQAEKEGKTAPCRGTQIDISFGRKHSM